MSHTASRRPTWRAVVAAIVLGSATALVACATGPSQEELAAAEREAALEAERQEAELRRQLIQRKADACSLGDDAACASLKLDYEPLCVQGDRNACIALEELRQKDLLALKVEECNAGVAAACREAQTDLLRYCNQGDQRACAALDALAARK